MKRVLIVLTVLLTVQFAYAQTEAARKAVESAEAASQDAKKAVKVKTWLKLADAYMDAYDAPTRNILLNTPRVQLQYMMGSEQPESRETVTIDNLPYVKESYSNKDLYFDANDNLVLVDVTKPIFEDALAGALAAYVKAYEVDVKKSKEKDVVEGIEAVSRKYFTDGMNKYMIGDMKTAGVLLGKAADASETAPLSKVDTTALYNAGYVAWAQQDYTTAKGYFERCLEAEYYYDNGETFAKLADVYMNLGEKEKAVTVLEKGFSEFPQSQSILIGLINYYLESGENADRLFVLIDEAKKNEPDNVSLYYVEGNIYKELGNYEKAVECYYRCAEVNPEYDFGFYGAGTLYYDRALALSEQASQELDDNKYMELVKEFEQSLLNAIDPFEKAFAVSKNDQLKLNVAEYLKNIYYRFSSVEDKYMEGYKKYDAIVKSGKVN
ncbi:MAG: tetratricopeptide repeat protein [Bacteroidales bacterium]|nr:tetratricopeptide repeat protein [Bacteroidales bacterium]